MARELRATASVSVLLTPTRSRADSSVTFFIRQFSNRIRDTFDWGMADLFIASGTASRKESFATRIVAGALSTFQTYWEPSRREDSPMCTIPRTIVDSH